MLEERAVALIRSSFDRLAPMGEEVAQRFRRQLLGMDPGIRPHLAKTDQSGGGLFAALAFAVAHLDRPEVLMPAARALATLHRAHGVPARHYDTAGAALIWTLEETLGPEGFPPETRRAWAAAYTTLADAMRDDGAVAGS